MTLQMYGNKMDYLQKNRFDLKLFFSNLFRKDILRNKLNYIALNYIDYQYYTYRCFCESVANLFSINF